jgi:hypothetical protein
MQTCRCSLHHVFSSSELQLLHASTFGGSIQRMEHFYCVSSGLEAYMRPIYSKDPLRAAVKLDTKVSLYALPFASWTFDLVSYHDMELLPG